MILVFLSDLSVLVVSFLYFNTELLRHGDTEFMILVFLSDLSVLVVSFL